MGTEALVGRRFAYTMSKSLLALVAVGMSVPAKASYPSAYPFEMESVVPPAPLSATPSWAADDADPGGYTYTFNYMRTELTGDGRGDGHNDDFCFAASGMLVHYLQAKASAPPVLDATVWNCTRRGHIISADTFWGTLGDAKICEVGECCKHLYGFPTYFSAEPMANFNEHDGTVYAAGMCAEPYSEELYCTKQDNGLRYACFEQFLTDTERLHTFPCHDMFYNYLINCKLYAQTGYAEDTFAEPESYTTSSSPDQLNAWTTVYMIPDKVCTPYSYFYPETATKPSVSEGGNVEEVCGECGNSCADGLPATCDDVAKLLESGNDLAKLTAKGECAASCSDECVALITDAFGSCDSIKDIGTSTSGAALNG